MDIFVDLDSLCFSNFKPDNPVLIISLLSPSLRELTRLYFLNPSTNFSCKRTFTMKLTLEASKVCVWKFLLSLEYTIFERKFRTSFKSFFL